MAYLPTGGQVFGTLTDLRSNAGTDGLVVYLAALTVLGDGNGGDYYWSATSTATDDGFQTVQVTGLSTGRWLRMKNANYASGSQVLSGNALQTAYVINHGLGVVPTKVFIQATTANAAVISWVSNKTTTSFTVNFASVPVVGTSNLGIDWLAMKN